MTESTELERRDTGALAVQESMSIEQLVAQVNTIQQAMERVMKDDEHYGVIPGTNKPTLLKPGAEKLLLLFRLGPRYRTEKTYHEDGHLTVTAICELVHIPTGNFVSEGEGMCTTKESKYAYRRADRLCPECGQPFLLKSRNQPEWFCWRNPDRGKHGCGAKFPLDDSRVVNQETGRVANPDLADSYNTVLKMAAKRALIAAVLNGTAASDIFTQDLEDESRSVGQSAETGAAGLVAGEPVRSEAVAGSATTTSQGGAAEPSAGSDPTLSAGSEASTGATAPAAPSPEEEADRKDALLSLIEQAWDAELIRVGDVVRTASPRCLEMKVKVPTKKADVRDLPVAVLEHVAEALKLEERIGAVA